MNDKLAFENYLLVLKSTVEVYVHGTLESSNEIVREILNDSLNEILSYQYKTYKIMENNDWYQNENINKNKINNTLLKLENSN